MLFQQFDTINHHAAVNRLEHVINRKQCDGCGGQRFHFNTGATNSFRGGVTSDKLDCGFEQKLMWTNPVGLMKVLTTQKCYHF